jgi:uncharacterized protein
VIVVSDTSALVVLCALEQEQLLASLFGEVLVPPAVAREFARPRRLAGVTRALTLPASVRVQAPTSPLTLSPDTPPLDDGEAEALALAVEVRAGLLLMDERAGRAEARRRGLHVTGVVGVLIRAKHAGLVPGIAGLLRRAADECDFWLDDTFVAQVLASVGETGFDETK